MVIKTIIILSLATLSLQDSCKSPSIPKNFTNMGYQGLWYEIGKIQTAGGAIFEKDCVCTTIDVVPVPTATNSDHDVINSCRKLSPTGDFLNATGHLVNEGPVGKWKESFFPLAPKADYNVIYMDEEMAVEYDCSTFLFSTNYCIHILARHPTADPTNVARLVNWANSLGLNTQNLKFQQTRQNGCW